METPAPRTCAVCADSACSGVFPTGRAGAVAALLLHRAELDVADAGQRQPLGVRLRHPAGQELYDVAPWFADQASGATSSGCPSGSPRARTVTARTLKSARPGLPRSRPTTAAGRPTCASRPRRHRRPPVGAGVLERHPRRLPVRAVEDIAYDKRRGRHNVVYLADSGRGSAARVQAEDTAFRSTNGRVWRMVLDKRDPRKVRSLRVLVEGDDSPVKTLGEVHQPDNLESTRAGLMITEDPGRASSSRSGPIDANATTARLWFAPFCGHSARRRQGRPVADGGSTDRRRPAGRGWGAWESTGVVDASSVVRTGAFLINVQAHSSGSRRRPARTTTATASRLHLQARARSGCPCRQARARAARADAPERPAGTPGRARRCPGVCSSRWKVQRSIAAMNPLSPPGR